MAFVFMALSLQELKVDEKVPPLFQKAIQISPNNTLAWNGLANFYEKQHKEDRSAELVQIYTSILKLETDEKKLKEIIEKLGVLPIPVIYLESAVEVLKKIVENPNIHQSIINIAYSALACIISKAPTCDGSTIDIYEKALLTVLSDENLSTRQYYVEYLKILYKKKEYNDLFKYGRKMLALYTTDLSSIKWMCRTYSELFIEEDQSNYCTVDEIRRYCTTLLQLEADCSIGLLTQGVLFYKDNQLLEACKTIKQCMNYSILKLILIKVILVTISKPELVHGWILLALSYFKRHIYNLACDAILKSKTLLESGNGNDKLEKQLVILLPKILSKSTQDEYLQKAIKHCIKELSTAEDQTVLLEALIKCYINLQKLSEAKMYLSKLNQSATYVLLKAQLLHKDNHLMEALSLLEENKIDTAESWCEVGTLYWELGLFEKSLLPFLKAARLDPNCYFYFLHLGNYYKKFDDIDKARRCYEKVYAMNSNCIEAVAELSKIYRSQQNWDANVALLQNLTEGVLNPDNRWAWLQLGLNFLEQEDYLNAINTLRFVVRRNPDDGHCWESLADAYMARGAYTSALKCYQKATEIMPNALYPLLQTANIKKALGEFSEAIVDYENTLNSNSLYVPALKGLAETYILQARQCRKSRKLGLARQYAEYALNKAIFAIQQRNYLSCLWKIAGDSCIIVANLPHKYCQMLVLKAFCEGTEGEGNIMLKKETLFKLAERCYYKAVTMMQNNSLLWYDLAACCLSHAQNSTNEETSEKYYSKAANIIEHCVSLDPSLWQHWNLMGVIAVNQGKKNYALAQHAFSKAVTVETNSSVAWCNLGTLYLLLGDFNLANEAYSQAQRSDPNYVNSWIGQALIAETLGMDDAMDLFRHSTLLGYHHQGSIGYGNWVCNTLINMPPHTTLYSIHNMHAIPVACDAMTWYTEENPDDPCGWNMLGLLSERMGLKEVALTAFEKALSLTSRDTRDKIIVNCGRILFKLGKYTLAIGKYEEVEEATFYSGIGLALSLFKDKVYDKSYETYEQALHWLTDEQAHQSHILVALASMVYMFQGPDSAKTLLLQSTELKPPSPYGFYATLSLGLLHGDSSLAKLVLKELDKLQDNADCRSHYAKLICYTYLLENKGQTAVTAVSKLIHIYPDDASLWLTLSILLIRFYKVRMHTDSMDDAANCAQLAVELGRTTSEISQMLCIVSLASIMDGCFSKALIYAQKAVHCYPDVSECWAVLISSIKGLKSKSDKFQKQIYLKRAIDHMNIKQMSQLEDVLKMKANVTCSSLPGTPTISMSSTIAHTPKTDAGVQELTHSGDVAGQMEALFGLTESETIGGTISQYISINRNGTTNTLRSESAEDLHLYGKEFINLSTRELYFKFNNSVRLYNAPNGEVSDYYYTLEESLLILEKVIMYQCWDDKGKFIQFFMDCLIICDKLKSKVNCLFIQSDPNGGKNYIMDSILHCNFHFGLVGNFNRYCSFPLMECIDKRILMWNEPSCEPSAFETLKMLLFGGDSCNVKVNYKSDTVISHTPIIILSNNDLFPRDEAFCSRMIYYKWRTYPMLKDYNKNFTTNILLFT
ncbi:hypothetical protein FQA39_LY09883 [Lamprigera yunnana]|nr:hypothetical protein FQA39_LY09883 [Lamprigera yunnana]